MSLSAIQLENLMREWIPMAEPIDLKVECFDDGRSLIRIPFNDKNKRPGGTVSGAVLMVAAIPTFIPPFWAR